MKCIVYTRRSRASLSSFVGSAWVTLFVVCGLVTFCGLADIRFLRDATISAISIRSQQSSWLISNIAHNEVRFLQVGWPHFGHDCTIIRLFIDHCHSLGTLYGAEYDGGCQMSNAISAIVVTLNGNIATIWQIRLAEVHQGRHNIPQNRQP